MGIQITEQNEQLVMKLDRSKLETGEREVKGKATGTYYQKYSEVYDAKMLEKGTPLVPGVGGQQMLKKVTVLIETVSEEQQKAKAAAKFGRTFIAELKAECGLNAKKKPTGDAYTVAELSDWILGKRKVMGRDFAALPKETQTKVHEVQTALAKKEQAAKAEKPVVTATQRDYAMALSAIIRANPTWDDAKCAEEAAKIVKAQVAEKKANGETVGAKLVKAANNGKITPQGVVAASK